MQASVIAVHMPVGIPALHTSAVGFNPYLLRRHALGSIRAELKCFKPCHTHERPRLSLWFLVSVWYSPRPGHCGDLGAEPIDER